MLYRRVLLVRPDLENLTDASTTPGVILTGVSTLAQVQAFQRENDLSVRWVDTNGDNVRDSLVMNSLDSLAHRGSRFAHVDLLTPPSTTTHAVSASAGQRDLLAYNASGVPTAATIGLLQENVASGYYWYQGGDFVGEDVAVTHVIGFDVKVYDPNAPVQSDPTNYEAVVPGDPGFGATGATTIGQGAYVDLYYAGALPTAIQWKVISTFSGPPLIKSKLFIDYAAASSSGRVFLPTYDTWSEGYESDGVDQDGAGGADQGANGFDDDNLNGVDDLFERETAPPYDVPLRGLQVSVRIFDPDSRQVRQMTVVQDFKPE